MPTYSYRCTECSTAFDIQQAFTDDSLTECPACQGRLRKVFSAIGVTFNGSGFYRTDSRASGKPDSGKSDAGKSDSSKTDSSKSDSGKSDSGKSDSGKSDSGKSDSGGTAAPKKTESTASTSTPAAAPAAR